MTHITREIAALAEWTIRELRKKWEEIYSSLPPLGMSRDLLIRAAAHRIQEAALGGLDKRAKNQLRRISQNNHSDKRNPQPQNTSSKSDTKFIREWHGRTYTVTKQIGGFEFKDQIYRSLSQIACEITGTRWSGPRFFGLGSNEARHE